MNLRNFEQDMQEVGNSSKMPVLILGHGSPMNAIEENIFVKGFRAAAKYLPIPQVILCISAHWFRQRQPWSRLWKNHPPFMILGFSKNFV